MPLAKTQRSRRFKGVFLEAFFALLALLARGNLVAAAGRAGRFACLAALGSIMMIDAFFLLFVAQMLSTGSRVEGADDGAGRRIAVVDFP